MKKIVSSVIILFALGLTELQAQNATDCETKTSNCQSLSLNLDPTNTDQCNTCHQRCSDAQAACKNDKLSLESANASKLYCTNHCPNKASSSSKSQ